MNDERTSALARRALVIEDDETILRLMRILLEDTGLRCTGFDNGEDAVEFLRKERVAIIVSDKNLPGMNGIEVIAEAKRLDPWIKAIVITGYASEDSAVEAMGLGVDAYISKPIDLHDFRKLLFSLLPGLEKTDPEAPSPKKREAVEFPTARIEEKLRRIGAHMRAQAGPDEESPAGVTVGRRPAAVLIIDEDAEVREALILALSDKHSVTAFDTARNAKSHVLRLGCDVIIAGRELLLRNLEELTAACPIPPMGSIAIVPRRGVDITAELILLGARGMILTPIAPEEASSEVDKVLAVLRVERAAMSTIPPNKSGGDAD